MANSNQKFLFDTSFEGSNKLKKSNSDNFSDFMGTSETSPHDLATNIPEPEELVLPEGAVSLDDFELAKQTAYSEGFANGQEEAHGKASETNEAQVVQVLEQVTQELSGLDHSHQQTLEGLQSISMEVALKAIQKLFPSLEHSSTLDEITLVFRECLDRLPQEPRLVIRVSDTTLDDVQERLEKVASKSGFTGHLVFLSEPGMSPSDVRVEWAEGGAERNSAEMRQEIETILSRAITNLSLPGDPGQTSALSDQENKESAPAHEVAE
ncbi:MAG: FliH/SctL family protein [Halopseudomonas aestusnigri]